MTTPSPASGPSTGPSTGPASTPAPATAPASVPIELDITGMTCASCANRIERKLNKLSGVHATVNYATERATVAHPAGVSAADLLATVEAAGYAASVRAPASPPARDGADTADTADAADSSAETDALRVRLLVAAALTLPVVLLGMFPALRFESWEWVSLALSTPVVLWAGWPFHRAAAVNARHGATTMDTLVSLGVGAAYAWSLVALFLGGDLYLEAATVVTTFLLAGRWLEQRSKRRAGAALRALMSLGAQQVTVLRDGVERLEPAGGLAVGDVFVVRPGEKVATDGVVERGTSARGRLDAHRGAGAGRGRARLRGGRRDRQRRRAAGRPRDAGRRRHPARADGAAGRGGAERQGAGAAARGPGVRGVRAGRAGARGPDPGRVAGRRRQRVGRVHRRRRGPDHRLPVRAGPGHADRADGGHRPRRPARHPHQGARGAGVHPPDRHRRARQDRHGHHRADGAGGRGRGVGDAARGGTPDGRGRRGRLGAPGGPGDRGRRRRRAAGGGGVREPRGARGDRRRRGPDRAGRTAGAAGRARDRAAAGAARRGRGGGGPRVGPR